MSLPYENATSGDAALGEIRKVLTKFGCARFGTMTDTEAGSKLAEKYGRAAREHRRNTP